MDLLLYAPVPSARRRIKERNGSVIEFMLDGHPDIRWRETSVSFRLEASPSPYCDGRKYYSAILNFFFELQMIDLWSLSTSFQAAWFSTFKTVGELSFGCICCID